MSKYDFLIVGAGLWGSVFAHQAAQRGKRCLVIDKRDHVAGNIYTKEVEGIHIHEYGAHIFHTDNTRVWNYVNSLAKFNRYTNSPVAVYKGKLYNLPFNMNTFYQLWGAITPQQAKQKIEEQIKQSGIVEPVNLEEQAIKLVGLDIYEILIKGYTEKQWGRPPKELPAFIIKRLPVRFTYDNNYFNDHYQGIPIGGYTQIVNKMLEDSEVRLKTDFFEDCSDWQSWADRLVFTGCIDEFYKYRFGNLEYRSLRFDHEFLDSDNYQGNAVVNYTEAEIPYTRIIEHKHFDSSTASHHKTVITKEYPSKRDRTQIPYYPVNNETNNSIYNQYAQLVTAQPDPRVIFGGRLAEYKYQDMDDIIETCLKRCDDFFGAKLSV